MSHSSGAVRFSDNTILFYEYNGTTDTVVNHLYDNLIKVWDNWRNHNNLKCNCGRGEGVEIYSSYSGGSHWTGKACRFCKAFVESNFEKTITHYDGGFPIKEYIYLRVHGKPEWIK